MDRRERNAELPTALLAALQGWQAGVWTALPAIVQSFDAASNTITARPAIQAKRRNPDGTVAWVNLSLLVDVPVVWQGGGGYTMTFPIAKGDECLIVFASRCIDLWWTNGGYANAQAEMRMHDPSDGFALVGVRSKPRAVAGVSGNSATLRSDDGSVFVEVAAGNIKLKAPTLVTIDAPNATFTGNATVQGKLTYQNGLSGAGGANGSTVSGDFSHSSGNLTSNGTNLHTHTHSDPQGGTTGAPN